MTATFHMIAGAPDPVAPFSHAVEADGWLFLTGQMPFSGTSIDEPYAEGIETQTHRVIANLVAVLTGCGIGLGHVVSARIYLAHFEEDLRRDERGLRHVFRAGPAPGPHLHRRDGARQRRTRGNRLRRAAVGLSAFGRHRLGRKPW